MLAMHILYLSFAFLLLSTVVPFGLPDVGWCGFSTGELVVKVEIVVDDPPTATTM